MDPLHKVRFYFLIAGFLIAMPVVAGLHFGYTGKFLVATDALKDDPHFSNSVIYIFSHPLWGAKGIILNRPLDSEKNIFKGGPVHFSNVRAVILERPKFISRWKMQPLSVKPYRDHYVEERKYKGLSSWDFGQLEAEIRKNLWIVYDCDALKVLEFDYQHMRDAVMNPDEPQICKIKK